MIPHSSPRPGALSSVRRGLAPRLAFAALVAVALALASAPAAHAHEGGAYQVRANFLADGTYRVDVSLDLDHVAQVVLPPGPPAPPVAGLSDGLAAAYGPFLAAFVEHARPAFDGRPVRPQRGGEARPDRHLATADLGGPGKLAVRYTGPVPGGALGFTFVADAAFGGFTLAVRGANDPMTDVQTVAAGATSRVHFLDERLVPPSRLAVVGRYLVLGFEHILPLGLDHILFVLGLFLLSREWRPLLWQVSAFTLAHTITLGLSIYGVVSLPSSVVEPLIAASIVYVAVENVVSPKLRPWRVALVFGFGLLHGLGFAGVLTELGLPRGELLTALLSFNAGVELGQLTVIALAFLALAVPFERRSWYRQGVVVPASLAIALTGLYWAIERTFGG